MCCMQNFFNTQKIQNNVRKHQFVQNTSSFIFPLYSYIYATFFTEQTEAQLYIFNDSHKYHAYSSKTISGSKLLCDATKVHD